MRRRDFLKHSGGVAAALTTSPLYTFSSSQVHLRRKGARKKVIIVGAGLAGLSAAYELMQAGHEVTVLEARTRPGGRVHTLRDDFTDGLYAEAGATRIPSHHDFTLRYVEHFGLTLDPFRPSEAATIYHSRGQRMRIAPGSEVHWPYRLSAEEKVLGLTGIHLR